MRPIVVPELARSVLAEFESKQEAFPEYEVAGALRKAAQANAPLSQEKKDGVWAESAAFCFSPRRTGDVSDWETHFEHAGSLTQEDGTKVYIPDIKELDAEIIAHWERRLAECEHPILRARYADLLWDFRKAVTGAKAKVDDARTAIDSYVAASHLPISEPHIWQIRWVERALELAISINDSSRIEAARDAMFDLYDRVADPKLCGIWPFLFDNVYDNKKVLLTTAQEAKIIQSLEEILATCSDRSKGENFNPWGAEEAAKRLTIHYKRLNQPNEVQRVIRTYGQAFESIAQIASPLLAMSWQQPVFEAYQAEGMADDAKRVQLASKEKGKDAINEMAKISVPITISKEELDKFLEAITASGLRESLIRIAVQFIPKAADARAHLEWLQQTDPLTAMIGIRKVDAGQIVAGTGSIQDDPDGRLLVQIAENIDIAYAFLGSALDRLCERYSPTSDDLLAFLYESPVFDADRRGLIKKGLDAYLNHDHLSVAHLLVPQIEHALRRLLGMLGQPTNKSVRGASGIMEEKNLSHILEREDAIKRCLGEDIRLYFLVFLADRRGHNVRNELSHGLMADRQFVRQLSDRLLHVLLVLALLRKVDQPARDQASEGQ